MKEEHSDSDDVIQEEEISRIEAEEERANSFNKLYQLQKSQSTSSEKKPLDTVEIPQPIDKMYIIFSFFKEEMQSIGAESDCRIKLIVNMIKITSYDNDKEKFDKCVKKIMETIEEIVYMKIQNIVDRHKFYNSPYFNSVAKREKFFFTKFDRQVMIFSNKMKLNELKNKAQQLFYGSNVFQILFKPPKSKDIPIYDEMRKFMRRMIEEKNEEFKERSVKVELGVNQNSILFIGQKQADCMFAKNTMRNILESMVIVVIKNEIYESLDGQKKIKKMVKYVKKVSPNYPIEIGLIGKAHLSIISKDNILKKLFSKESFLTELKLDPKKQFGLFLPLRFNFQQKKSVIQNMCSDKGFDFSAKDSVYHVFKRVFIPENNQKSEVDEILNLFSEVMDVWKDIKEKYSVIKRTKYVNEEQNYLPFDGQYQKLSQSCLDEQISQKLRKDVIRYEVKMGKAYLVAYNVLDCDEVQLYWFLDEENNKIRCNVQDMQPGREYFKGKLKQNGQEKNYFIEAILIVV